LGLQAPCFARTASVLEDAMKMTEIDRMGAMGVGIFHRVALFGIGAATIWAAAMTFVGLFAKQHASIQDLLLLFIYLEIGAMVGIYFSTNHMPVRFLMYIAITALTRHMIDLISMGHGQVYEVMALGGTTLILSLSILIVRYASYRFRSGRPDEDVS
jgi:protein PsiE